MTFNTNTHSPEQLNRLIIVIPTYNEIQNVPEIIRQIETILPAAHILFVDDASSDGTASYIKGHKDYLRKIFIYERLEKLGLGSAYITGFKWSLEKNSYHAICQMDADLSHNPKYLKHMIEKLRDYDLVIASRYIEGGGVENWGIVRKFISKFGSLYARIILGINVCDLTGGFNLWRTDALKKLKLDNIRSEGYSFQIELKYRAFKKKFLISEFPIIFRDRYAGMSKMSFKIFIEAFYRVIQMKFKDE